MAKNRMDRLVELKKIAKSLEEYKAEAEIAYSNEFKESKQGRVDQAKTKNPADILSSIRDDVAKLESLDFGQVASRFGNNGFDLAVVLALREDKKVQTMPTRSGLGLGDDGDGDNLVATTLNTDEADAKKWLAWRSFKQGYSYGYKQVSFPTKPTSSGVNEYSFKLVNDSAYKLNIFDNDEEKNFYKTVDINGSIDLESRKDWFVSLDGYKDGFVFDINQDRVGATYNISELYNNVYKLNVKKPQSKNESGKPASSSGTQQAASSSSVGGGSTGPVQLVAPAGTKLTETAGNVTYNYTIKGPLEFSFNTGGNQEKTVTPSSFKKWDAAAKNLNTLYEKTKAETTPAPTTPAATTEAANAPAAKPAEAEKTLNPITIKNVQAILTQASKMRLAMGTSENERGRIRDMIETIRKEKPNIDAFNFLAQAIIRKYETYLDSLLSGKDISGEIYTADRSDLKIGNKKGAYSKLVAAVLACMNEIYDNDYNNETEDSKVNFVKNVPIQNKASENVDQRIKKLARLRRLRVRSQMEAATESSAQFGRSRIS